jgi:hypothetical protein
MAGAVLSTIITFLMSYVFVYLWYSQTMPGLGQTESNTQTGLSVLENHNADGRMANKYYPA